MAPRTPLLHSDRYFADREPNFFRVMAVVGLLIAAGPITVYGVGWVLTATVDGTIMVDNPDRPPESYCETAGDCEAPKEIERDIDPVLWDVFEEFAGISALVYPLWAVVIALLLHAGAWIVGAERGLFPTFAVTVWGLVPSVALIAVSLLGLWVTLDPITVTPGEDLGAALAPLRTQLEAFGRYSVVGTGVTALWAGVIWRFGLVRQQELPGTEATLIAGLVAAIHAAVGLL